MLIPKKQKRVHIIWVRLATFVFDNTLIWVHTDGDAHNICYRCQWKACSPMIAFVWKQNIRTCPLIYCDRWRPPITPYPQKHFPEWKLLSLRERQWMYYYIYMYHFEDCNSLFSTIIRVRWGLFIFHPFGPKAAYGVSLASSMLTASAFLVLCTILYHKVTRYTEN